MAKTCWSSHPKLIDMHATTTSTSTITIERLRHRFATHGLPHILICGNGPCFSNSEFVEFTKRNGIRHKHVSPYHQTSNGLVELSVGLVKNGLKICLTTPQTTTGTTPAKLLKKRRLRTNLDRMEFATSTTVFDRQDQKFQLDRTALMCSFSKGKIVFEQNFSLGTYHS